jgi:hypothetical protein
VPELKKLMADELKTDAGESVHVAHDDGRGAEVRDVEYLILRQLAEAQGPGAMCGGMVPGGGTAEQPHVWVLTKDGAGLTRAESGVRLDVATSEMTFACRK